MRGRGRAAGVSGGTRRVVPAGTGGCGRVEEGDCIAATTTPKPPFAGVGRAVRAGVSPPAGVADPAAASGTVVGGWRAVPAGGLSDLPAVGFNPPRHGLRLDWRVRGGGAGVVEGRLRVV